MSIEANDPTPVEQTKKAWNREAGKFWKFDKDKPITLNDFFTKFFREHRDKIRDILDIGCGSGRYLIPMVQDGKQVTGLDISDEMIVEAQTHLNFPEESFDFVLAKGSIHHNTFAGIQQSFGEIARVLRPGMFFLFQGRSTNDPGLKPSELIPDVGSTAQGVKFGEEGVIQHYFIKEELEQLAQENGFEIVTGPEEQVQPKKHARWWVVYRKI